MQSIPCPPAQISPDYTAIKARQQATWASGDFARIGSTLQLVGETLCEAVDLHAGQRVLDVAAGNGNAALAAARCGCDVVASDYVPALLAGAVRRAEADGLPLRVETADAERLPFADGSFDAVLSTFGVMFAPDQESAASELLRVCRAGGKIGLASWTSEGFLGELFRVIGRFVPPPAGLRSPMAWGSEARMRELFGAKAEAIRCERKQFAFRYRSAAHFVEVFRTYYGPTLKAFAAVAEDKRPELAADMVALAERYNRAGDGTLVAPAEYLEVVIGKR
jgi:ubiquinone/menaquinone biosynthesis C-methylase UbiE